MKETIDKVLTYSRATAFFGWLASMWAILEATGGPQWPLKTDQVIGVIGGTIAWLGRSGLADPKRPAVAPSVPHAESPDA